MGGQRFHTGLLERDMHTKPVSRLRHFETAIPEVDQRHVAAPGIDKVLQLSVRLTAACLKPTQRRQAAVLGMVFSGFQLFAQKT